jgi:hypothetical protein
MRPEAHQAALLIAQGLPYPKVAVRVGRSPRWVDYLMAEQSFRDYVDSLRDDLDAQAVAELRAALSSEHEHLRIHAALELSRRGVPA